MEFSFKLDGKIKSILNESQKKKLMALPSIILSDQQRVKITDEMECLKMSIDSQTKIRRLMKVSISELNESITKIMNQYEELDFIIEASAILEKYTIEKKPMD